jgi:hypothetical protein
MSAAPPPSLSLLVGPHLLAGPPILTPPAFLSATGPQSADRPTGQPTRSLPSLSSPASLVCDPAPPFPGCRRPTMRRSCSGPPARARAMAGHPPAPPRGRTTIGPPPKFSLLPSVKGRRRPRVDFSLPSSICPLNHSPWFPPPSAMSHRPHS